MVLSAQPSSASPPSWPSKLSVSLKSCNPEVLILHGVPWHGRVESCVSELSSVLGKVAWPPLSGPLGTG